MSKYVKLQGITKKCPHSESGGSQVQETFLAPSGDKQTHNYDIVIHNHPSQSP